MEATWPGRPMRPPPSGLTAQPWPGCYLRASGRGPDCDPLPPVSCCWCSGLTRPLSLSSSWAACTRPLRHSTPTPALPAAALAGVCLRQP